MAVTPERQQARFRQALALDQLLGIVSTSGCGAIMEPRLNILLDLYINEQRGRALTVGDACIAARVPATTALRVIDALEQDKMIIRFPDRMDSRRRRLAMQPSGQNMVEMLLDQLISASSIALRLN